MLGYVRLGLYSGYELWRLRLFSFCGYGLALAALALVVFGAYDSYPVKSITPLDNKRWNGDRNRELGINLHRC